MRALVPDVHLPGPIAGMRALAAAGVEVGVLAPHRLAGGLYSRRPVSRALGPSVVQDPAGFVDSVVEQACALGGACVFPGREDALEAILDHRDRLGPEVTLPLAPTGALDALRDKRRLGEVAEAAGLRSPRQLAEGTVGELRGAALELPGLVKTATAVGSLGFPEVVETPADLDRLLAALPEQQTLIVQEYLPGPVVAVNLVVDRAGEIAARMQQRSVRWWPAAAGTGSWIVSEVPDETLIGRVAVMLASVGFWGLVMVQLIDTGQGLVVIDANPRYYQSLALAAACGVNLPAAWHAVATDGRPQRPGPYRTGVTYRWLEADISAAFRGHRDRLRPQRPTDVGLVWDRSDPVCSTVFAADTVVKRIKARLRRPPI